MALSVSAMPGSAESAREDHWSNSVFGDDLHGNVRGLAYPDRQVL